MINKYNIGDLSLANRPVQGTKEGFGAVIAHHPGHYGARRFNTESRDYFGQPAHGDPAATQAAFAKDQSHCGGGQTRPYDAQKTRCLSKLTGEQYNEVYDPQGQTDVQRSWLYQKDPSLHAAAAGFSAKS